MVSTINTRQASAPDVHKECEQENLSWIRRTSRLTVRQCEAENVVIGPDERIVFTRTIPYVSDLYSKGTIIGALS